MKKAVSTIISYNFKTGEVTTKEFAQSQTCQNPVLAAEVYRDKNLVHSHSELDGWMHKLYSNKPAVMIQKKAWGLNRDL